MTTPSGSETLGRTRWASYKRATLDDPFHAIVIGSGIGGLQGIEEASLTLHNRGPRRISPFFIPGRLINLASGHVSIRYGLKVRQDLGGTLALVLDGSLLTGFVRRATDIDMRGFRAGVHLEVRP